ncbi:MAG TPA: hypothetical protein VEN81_00880 [Planctomycetota bacterium]|nr:hypothetical protein [Planctomycetota bacterium]
MSYAIQIICGIAIIVGASYLSKIDSEQVRLAAVYALLGVPFIAGYIVGTGRTMLMRLDAIERRLDPNRKEGAA